MGGMPTFGGPPGGMSFGGPFGPQVQVEEVSQGGTPAAERPGHGERRQLMGPPSRSPTPRQTPPESVQMGSSSKSRTQTPMQRVSPRSAEQRRGRSPKRSKREDGARRGGPKAEPSQLDVQIIRYPLLEAPRQLAKSGDEESEQGSQSGRALWLRSGKPAEWPLGTTQLS